MLVFIWFKFFVLVYGEYWMLVQYFCIGYLMGVLVDNILIIDNGDVVEFILDLICKGNVVKVGIELLD